MQKTAPARSTIHKPKRIRTLDLMRGYFLCVILLDHLYYYPNGLDAFTGRGILYVSTAEGFFVVSGIVLGMVRGAKLIGQPFSTALKLLWKRAFQLYLASIILTFLFTLVGQLFLNNEGLKYGIYTDWSNWWELIFKTLTLQYTYGWADFLRLYALFIFFAPLALWLLRKGYWYILGLLSIGIWALYPIFEYDTALAQVFSWQLIFFGGFIIGFYWKTITKFWQQLSPSIRRRTGITVASVFILTGLISSLLVFSYELPGTVGTQLNTWHQAIDQSFDKERLPIPRLLLGIVWFWGLFYLFHRFEKPLIKRLGWLLLPLGMNSLYVYVLSAFVVFFMHLLVAPPGSESLPLNLALSSLALAIVYVALRKRLLFKIIPR